MSEVTLREMATDTIKNRPTDALLWILQLEQENKKLKRQKTLRDEFAMATLAGTAPMDWNCETIADTAYAIADAMLERREKK